MSDHGERVAVTSAAWWQPLCKTGVVWPVQLRTAQHQGALGRAVPSNDQRLMHPDRLATQRASHTITGWRFSRLWFENGSPRPEIETLGDELVTEIEHRAVKAAIRTSCRPAMIPARPAERSGRRPNDVTTTNLLHHGS